MSEVTTVITDVVDPSTDKKTPKAKGIIKRINIKPINADGSPKITNITKGINAGKTIKSTHRYSILLEVGQDSAWISFGEGEVKVEKYADQFQIKVGNDYKNLLPGMEISVYPVEARQYEKDGKPQTAYQAKKKSINLLSEEGAIQPSAQSSSKPASSGAVPAGGNKIFGEIISIDNGVAQVKDEKLGIGPVVLGDHEKEVSVGGRLGAIVDQQGNILSGFKVYGPAGSTPGGKTGGGKGAFKKDNTGVEIGHAVNGALNLRRGGYKIDTIELAKLVHDITISLKEVARQDEANKSVSDYDLGASIGHAVLNATRDVTAKKDETIESVVERITVYAKGLLEKVIPGVTEYVKAGGQAGIKAAQEAAEKEAAEKAAAEAASQQQASQPQKPKNHIDMSQPPIDFDEDIPF